MIIRCDERRENSRKPRRLRMEQTGNHYSGGFCYFCQVSRRLGEATMSVGEGCTLKVSSWVSADLYHLTRLKVETDEELTRNEVEGLTRLSAKLMMNCTRVCLCSSAFDEIK